MIGNAKRREVIRPCSLNDLMLSFKHASMRRANRSIRGRYRAAFRGDLDAVPRVLARMW